jgi:hypothetical protein
VLAEQWKQLLCCCHHFSLKYIVFDLVIRQVNTLTCQESFKIPGRYHATIIPCMSTIMQGLEIVLAAEDRGYIPLKEFSVAVAACVPEFAGLLGTLSG